MWCNKKLTIPEKEWRANYAFRCIVRYSPVSQQSRHYWLCSAAHETDRLTTPEPKLNLLTPMWRSMCPTRIKQSTVFWCLLSKEITYLLLLLIEYALYSISLAASKVTNQNCGQSLTQNNYWKCKSLKSTGSFSTDQKLELAKHPKYRATERKH